MILSIDEQRRRHWQALSTAEKITAFEELTATDCWAFLSAGIQHKIRVMIEGLPAPARQER